MSRITADGRLAKLRHTLIHWGRSGTIHSSPECGSTSHRVVSVSALVTCPRCLKAVAKARATDSAAIAKARGGK